LAFVRQAQDDIVVIDGVTSRDDHAALKNVVFSFDFNPNRQAISVASIYIKTNWEDENRLKLSWFVAAPWPLDEYYEATKNEEFFNSVRPFLVNDGSSHGNISEEMKDLVDQKYYFAGCSARWMFGNTISSVIKQIDKYFSSAPNFVDLLKGIVRLQNPDMVNHLACEQGSGGKRIFTSQYIVREAICKDGNEVVRLAYGVANSLQNASFTGWIVEMDFIRQIMDAKGAGLNVILANTNSLVLRFIQVSV